MFENYCGNVAAKFEKLAKENFSGIMFLNI